MKLRFLTMAAIIVACLALTASTTLANQSTIGSPSLTQMAVDGEAPCEP